MYYRVKKFNSMYANMFVLDYDENLNKLKSRTNLDCGKIGYKSFNHPSFVESQQIKCVSLGGILKESDIIKE